MKNEYTGKKFSILADSISTFKGCNPEGYNVFYDGEKIAETGVETAEDTWWSKVISYFGGTLLVNNSWSGSRVTRLPDSGTLFPSGCSDERTGGLSAFGDSPEVILVWLVTNDMLAGAVPRFDPEADADPTLCFDTAYETMLRKLTENYPKAKIVCLTAAFGCRKCDPSFVQEHPRERVEKYNAVIREKAEQFGFPVVELFDERKKYDSIDGYHPTADGMKTLAENIIKEMLG